MPLSNIDKSRMQQEMQVKAAELKKQMEQERSHSEMQSKAHTSMIKKELRAAKQQKADHKTDEAFKKMVDNAAQIRQAGYDSWLSAMSEIVGMCRLLLDAKPLNLLIGGIAEAGFSGVEKVTGKIADKLTGASGSPGVDLRPGALFDGAISSLENLGKEPANLACLQHYIDFTSDPAGGGDKLNLATIGTNMRRSDGKDFTKQQEDSFKYTLQRGVTLWLDDNGYDLQPNTEDSFVSRTTGQPLTKDEFEALRDDPDRGLDAFLSGTYDMHFEQASGPRPSPRP